MLRGFANDAFNGSGKDQNIIIKRTMSRLYPGDLLDHFILFPFRGGQHLFIVHREDHSLLFAAGAFQGGAATPDVVDKLATAFSTGIGLTYDELGESAAHVVERMLAPWSKLALVPELIPRIAGLQEKLQSGAYAADVGC